MSFEAAMTASGLIPGAIVADGLARFGERVERG